MRFTFIDSFLSTQSQDQYEIQRSLTILTYWYKKKKKRKAQYEISTCLQKKPQNLKTMTANPSGWALPITS